MFLINFQELGAAAACVLGDINNVPVCPAASREGEEGSHLISQLLTTKRSFISAARMPHQWRSERRACVISHSWMS